MPTKPTLFLQPNPLPEPEPLSTRHSRVIFCIGGDRFAVDFTSTVTELKPQPADVISIRFPVGFVQVSKDYRAIGLESKRTKRLSQNRTSPAKPLQFNFL